MLYKKDILCDHCGTVIADRKGFTASRFTHLRFCSPRCVDAFFQSNIEDDQQKMFTITRGWIDITGKCRTWKVQNGIGEHIAEVTRKRDAERLVRMLTH